MLVKVITSESNDYNKFLKSLTGSKGIKENKQFILSGTKLINEFFEKKLTRFKVVDLVYHSDDWSSLSTAADSLNKTVIPKSVFKEVDIIGTNEPLLVLEFKPFEEKNFSDPIFDLELIAPIGDPRNLGALIRSGVGFGINEIILTQETTHPFLPHSVKASAGAVLYANFKKTNLKISEIPLVEENFALDLEGSDITNTKWPKNLRLWVGEEGPGLKLTPDQRNKMNFISISTNRIESLNATVSATIAIWEWNKSLKSK
ncbi:MAG: TrmH family RNA methyltransferase [Pseudobdellovibrio sp.]